MQATQSTSSQDRRIQIVGISCLVVIAALYAGLSLIALYAPTLMPGASILVFVLRGPIALLGNGSAAYPLYWICTAVIAIILAFAARYPKFQLAAVIVVAAIWLSAGFFPVLMSV